MSVTTKKGDEGQTDLLFGERIDKDDLRIEIIRLFGRMQLTYRDGQKPVKREKGK